MHIRVVGIGAGDPEHITMGAIKALNAAKVVFYTDKGGGKSELAAVRLAIAERYLDPGRTLVPFTPPVRDARIPGYESGVNDWHARLAETYRTLLTDHLGPEDSGAFMVWGDPGLYDSTLRILDRVIASGLALTYDVVPGITAIQALTAAHRIPLNRIGAPVHITTGRRLAELGLSEDAVVMLDGEHAFSHLPDDVEIFWGAYLGTPDEILIAGPLGEVRSHILATRAAARVRHGWIMDIYLLRKPRHDPPGPL